MAIPVSVPVDEGLHGPEPARSVEGAAVRRQRSLLGGRSMLIDVVRGIAITLVVWGHTNQGIIHRGWWGASKIGEHMDAAVYTFHMPAFFFVSGTFLCAGVEKRGMGRYTVQRLRTVIYPYLLWSAIFYVGLVAFRRYTVQGVPAVHTYLSNVATGNVSWFLPTIFVALMLGMLLRTVPMALLFAGSAVVGMTVPALGVGDIDRALHELPFLVAGMWVGLRFERVEGVPKVWGGVAAGAIAWGIWAMAAGGGRWLEWLYLPLGLLGTLMLLLVARVLGRGWAARGFAWAGEASFGIFLLSQFPQGGGRELVRQVLHTTWPLPQLVIPTALAVGLPGLMYQYRERLRIGWMFVWPFSG